MARSHTCSSAHDEPDTRAIVAKIGGLLLLFWGALRPPPNKHKPTLDRARPCQKSKSITMAQPALILTHLQALSE
eukprot:scaffold53676_cov36-Cyclotella_meneghiniana.AAC.1